jgi:hypothetical protein
VLEALDEPINHGFGFGDWRKHEQMGQALFLNEFQIDAFGQCSFPQKEGIGIRESSVLTVRSRGPIPARETQDTHENHP